MTVPSQISNPVGVDYHIQLLQNHLSNNLSWLTHSFGRIYKNVDSEGKKHPEGYVSANEYMELLPDDTVNAMSFFDIANNVEYGDTIKRASTDIDIIFFVNLSKIKSTLTHRADENVIVDITDILINYKRGWELNNHFRYPDNVFGEFDDFGKSNLVDLQPFFVVKYTLTLTYDYKKPSCY